MNFEFYVKNLTVGSYNLIKVVVNSIINTNNM